MSIPVSVIVDHKGADVFTVRPGATLGEAAEELAAHNVGALVVSSDGRTVQGIVSERDIARCLPRFGAECMQRRVEEVMTTVVATCSPHDTVHDVMATMTKHRIRHVPVMAEGALAGIVSIGDVVKSRLDELEVQAQALEQYVTGSPA